MNKLRVLELLPFFALVTVAVIVTSVTLASAGFSFPDLRGKWSFGQPAPVAQCSVTTATNAYMPLNDLAVPAGIDMPVSDFNMFRSPVTSTQKYTSTFASPAGLKTRSLGQSFDSMTGQLTRTLASL
jgi:hypothetical protein